MFLNISVDELICSRAIASRGIPDWPDENRYEFIEQHDGLKGNNLRRFERKRKECDAMGRKQDEEWNAMQSHQGGGQRGRIEGKDQIQF